ncbi:murein biosynthesis integral membrane protein MurJ [Bifidobacterium imperatoris]|uniref:Lipid II flippase MurJ n=1 Tax=Bifidobacterium imperatoris TaxID=2020965 RepID=A0A2N5IS19_9BIFI|nr:murein biosynthesis integral membrane protein MurJ [Bifidobacterium imperatoris]PLS24755.1 lipid II flippase MurJ [Bifidobacterium imperatoris]QSY58342.1 murein biosynthesis integral membrane protein MurJ [Bifidobacterium imperatoris]
MSSTVGRNSLIMASGTAASRVTGQIRTILLAAAMGTTGLAANAYQAGSMIPQAIFTLVTGGIFNAVLVPQIVRTLKEKDAQERLNRLITLAIVILLAVTVLMGAASPLLTRLYVGGNDSQMIALTTAFTLWCMPQIFFYGLYTVLGQILAAKDHFTAYAWSSTGANVISCAGFTAFILLFGKANEQPLDFWTGGKIALTAGTWTLGVAFQALILFIPLMRLGFKYRPQFGLTGFGLKAMGPVALGSLGVVVITEISGIIQTRIATLAPLRAHEMVGASLFDIAGNATYQNAYTLFILPYSLIAVSVSTAMFPKISRSIAEHNLDEARNDLSSALNNVGLVIMFFAAAMIVFPEPIIRALLPSVSMNETMLISYALIPLSFGIPLVSGFLLIQRTFYAFEDGWHPFLCNLIDYACVIALMVASMVLLPPQYWVVGIACSAPIGSIIALPPTLMMLRKKFNGHLGLKVVGVAYGKALAAAVVAGVAVRLLKNPIVDLFKADIQPAKHMDGGIFHRPDPNGPAANPGGGHMGWLSAVGICVVLTIVLAVVYVAVLWLLRTQELKAIAGPVLARLGLGRNMVASEATADDQPSDTPDNAQGISPSETGQEITPEEDFSQASPTDRMSKTIPSSISNNRMEPDTHMKPQLGDTILNRYTLVSALREEPGIEAWKANDRILAKDCQLYLVTDRRQLNTINEIAGTITATRPEHFVPVQKYRRQGDSMLVITPVDSGKSLTEYISLHSSSPLSFNAMRSIIGELSEAIRPMLHGDATASIVLTTDTVRISSAGIEITGAPFAPLLADTSGASLEEDGAERHAVRQLAALLYALLTRKRNPQQPAFTLAALPQDTPGEFQVICKRGLELFSGNELTLPMASLAELDALLGDWKPLQELGDTEIALPNVAGDPSIIRMLLNKADTAAELGEIPASLITSKQLPDLAITQAGPVAAVPGPNGAAVEEPGRHLFDFKFSDAWNAENLSGDDTADWFNDFNAPAAGAFAGNSHPTVPISTDGYGETTSRIPVYDAGGREIQPGEESLRALEEEQARIAEVAAIPPSYDPKNPPVKKTGEDDHLPNENLFGSFTTKVVALIVALVVVVAAGFWAWSAFQKSGVDPADATDTTKSSTGDWPDVNMNEVPFGDQKSSDSSSADDPNSTDSSQSSNSNSSSDSSNSGTQDSEKSSSSSSSSSAKAQKKSTVKKVVEDRSVKSVPQPHVVNTTAYTISSANFVSNPGGQSGYGYTLHLDQPHDVSRMIISIRSSGGKGYIRANTTGNPSEGEEMASFTFAEGGTTEVKFSKSVTTQDLMLWVPMDSLPQNQLYIQKVEVF